VVSFARTTPVRAAERKEREKRETLRLAYSALSLSPWAKKREKGERGETGPSRLSAAQALLEIGKKKRRRRPLACLSRLGPKKKEKERGRDSISLRPAGLSNLTKEKREKGKRKGKTLWVVASGYEGPLVSGKEKRKRGRGGEKDPRVARR